MTSLKEGLENEPYLVVACFFILSSFLGSLKYQPYVPISKLNELMHVPLG